MRPIHVNTMTMGYDRPVQFLQQVDLTSEQRKMILGADAARLLQLRGLSISTSRVGRKGHARSSSIAIPCPTPMYKEASA